MENVPIVMAQAQQQGPPGPASVDEDEMVAIALPTNYWQALVQYTKDEQEEPPIGEFPRLQRLNITHLLNEIARIEGDIKHNETTSLKQMNFLRQTLHQYGKYTIRHSMGDLLIKSKIADAIRDLQYITELNNITPLYGSEKRMSLYKAFEKLAKPYPPTRNYPYDTTYRTLKKKKTQNKDSIREFLRKNLPSRLSWTENERRARKPDYSHGKPPEIYSPLLDSLARFIIGTLGGCALIIPMVVMVLHSSLAKSLITVSIAVVIFALVLSLIFETDNKDTITATATYAAVLVVFVGTSGAGSGS